jgi:DNA-binding CsgD family transcriptional regulator
MAPAPHSELTAREWDIIRLLADGQASKEIASALGISVTTVSSHRKSLCRKLNVHSVAELIRSAIALVAASRLHFLVLPRAGDCGAAID